MIPYGKQFIDNNDTQAVVNSLNSDFLTTGPAVEAFENELCKLTGAKYAIACANGTAALHLACLALGIKKGDLGVTSPITFLASANCVEFCGGTIDFVDIDSSSLCLSVDKLEAYCKQGKRPAVVIPVDFAGIPANLPAIQLLSKSYNFRIIEDAAHSLGSTYTHNGKTYQCGCCEHSDLAIFSFHPVKTITTGEGGAIMTNDSELAAKLRLFRSHGMTKDNSVMTRNDGSWYYEMHELGFNYRITDMQCALGLSQLAKLAGFKKRRTEIVSMYNKAFQKNSDLILPPWPKSQSPCFHLYPIQFKQGALVRKKVFNKLKDNDIISQVHYIPVYWQPYYKEKYGFKAGKCMAAESYYEGCLSLPLFPAIKDSDVELVINTLFLGMN